MYVISVISMLLFFAMNEYVLVFLVAPPDEKCVPRSKRHKWRNIVTSLIHAVIVGLGAIHCFIQCQQSEPSDESYFGEIEFFSAFTAGYAVYDIIDLMKHNPLSKIFSLILHHVSVVVCIYTGYITGHFYKLAIIGMLVDVSNIFIHIRMLLIMYGFNERHPARVVNSLVNIVAFVIFRFVIIVYIMIAVFYQPGSLVVVSVVVSLFFAAFLVFNLVLFRRLIISDFVRPSSRKTSSEDVLSQYNNATYN